MRSARPNDAHRSLAVLETQGRIEQLVTQNVDGLHQAAGSVNVIDLHGRIDAALCMSCGTRSSRERLQSELSLRNPAFAQLAASAAPDGDADLDGVDFGPFDVPECAACGGLLQARRRVLRRERSARARAPRAGRAERADAMLVVGSSLMVYSGYRFVRAMAQAGKPVAAVNLGRTRADDLLTLKIAERCASALAFAIRGDASSAA